MTVDSTMPKYSHTQDMVTNRSHLKEWLAKNPGASLPDVVALAIRQGYPRVLISGALQWHISEIVNK